VLRPTREYYDDFASWYEEERDSGYHALVDRLEAELACRYGQGGRVLEAGCGTGLILQHVRDVASAAHGLDLSRGMLGKAAGKDLSCVQGSITDVPFPDEHFDLVYSFKVLAHVQPIERALAELVRVTRPGGHLLLEFYNRWSIRHVIKRLRPPLAISEKRKDDEVYTRYDHLAGIRAMLPADAEIIGLRGVRVFSALPQALRMPVVGPALTRLETWAADAPGVRRLGGFLIVIVRRAAR
jgi:ubiquinone/menaquinone biosynthesis C-methylase UbiE